MVTKVEQRLRELEASYLPRSRYLLEIERDIELTEAFGQRHARYNEESTEPYTEAYLRALATKLVATGEWCEIYHRSPSDLHTAQEGIIWNELEELIIIAKAMQLAVVG